MDMMLDKFDQLCLLQWRHPVDQKGVYLQKLLNDLGFIVICNIITGEPKIIKTNYFQIENPLLVLRKPDIHLIKTCEKTELISGCTGNVVNFGILTDSR